MHCGYQVKMGAASILLSGLLNDISELYAEVTDSAFLPRLVQCMQKWIPIEHAYILEFERGLQPRQLLIADSGYDHDLSEYLNGLYLLDPYYDLYENQNKTGVFKLNVEDWDEYSGAEIYKRYWRRVMGNNEVAGLYEISDGRCVHVSFMIQTEDDQLVQDAVELMKLLETNFRTLFKLHFRTYSPQLEGDEKTRRDLHFAVRDVLENFGRDHLSDRERQIVQLLLKGHSAKSIATLLNISPGTVGVHRSNIYQKLEVGSQGDLFSKFVANLTNLQ